LKKLLRALNDEQRDAVLTTEGPLLVLAGAGTGKTRVITYRIAHLLQLHVDPSAILAVTFTNKAAAEMRQRIAGLVGKQRAKELTVSTFHAFCLHALREHAQLMGWPRGFSICDANDQRSLLAGALRELHVPNARLKPRDLQSRISLAKNRLQTPDELIDGPGDETDELVGRAWLRYQDLLRHSRRLDFDDLLLEALRMLREHPQVAQAYHRRFHYLLVDEYQDTNAPQYEILRALAGERRNLCVVGDDDQSIYGWRGADVDKILSFDKHYPGAKVVRLETNYRSTEQILAVANRLIANNPKRHEKTLRSALGVGEPPRAVCMRDEEAEAEEVVREIREHIQQGAHYDEFAILFRTATQARTFEAELRAREVPYVLVGGMSFFDRKEVRDVLAYLRLVANPLDETSLLRILNCPPRGVGKSSIDRVMAFATEQGIPAAEAFARAQEIEGLPPRAAASVTGLLERLTALGRKFRSGKQLVELVERLLVEVAYKDEVTRVYPDPAEAERRWEAVLEILSYAENHVRRKQRPGLNTFLNELTLAADDRPDAQDAEQRLSVTLMTLHAAKGLEFPHVYLVGLEEGLLPHARAAAEDSIEEERRLAYVGVTRAQQYLTLSWCQERARAGHRAQCHPSRFLLEIQAKPPPRGWLPTGAPPTQSGKRGGRKTKRRGRAAKW